MREAKLALEARSGFMSRASLISAAAIRRTDFASRMGNQSGRGLDRAPRAIGPRVPGRQEGRQADVGALFRTPLDALAGTERAHDTTLPPQRVARHRAAEARDGSVPHQATRGQLFARAPRYG